MQSSTNSPKLKPIARPPASPKTSRPQKSSSSPRSESPFPSPASSSSRVRLLGRTLQHSHSQDRLLTPDLPSRRDEESNNDDAADGKDPPGGQQVTMAPSFPISTASSHSQSNLSHQKDHPLNEHIHKEAIPTLPRPRSPSKCALFCCFYAEFDIKVGPKVCFQSPEGFMDQDIQITTESIQQMLKDTFEKHQRSTKKEKAEDDSEVQVQDGGKESSKPPKRPEVEAKDDASSSSEDFPEGSLSIFDSISEYVITGQELAGKVISLSTHNMHILTRPTIINDKKYERNALMFSVGFVLRRAADPRPFRPLLSKWAITLQRMEIESEFLSKEASRERLQNLLAWTLISLNSSKFECNLILSQANALNLKLYHPPKPPSPPIPDHAVPILLRRDIQLQVYDWDLAINWVILHIDGITNARRISAKAEVDIEIVRACIRVLKYHGVIALVDMFMYTNHYEFTKKATTMLAGKEPKLLQDAIEFCSKRPPGLNSPALSAVTQSLRKTSSPGPSPSSSPQIHPSSSYPPPTMNLLGGSTKSSNFRYAMMAAHSLEKEPSVLQESNDTKSSTRMALAELYCACNRTLSFGDLWMMLCTESAASRGDGAPVIPNLSRHGSSGISAFGRTTPLSRQSAEFQSDSVGALSASPAEASHIETIRKSKSFERNDISWSSIFQSFDHRRFISFGIVHGLLKRIHNYPLVVEKPMVEGSDNKKHLDAKQRELAKRVANAMDGSRCDDELASKFEMPFSQILALVESLGNVEVCSLYSESPEFSLKS